MALTSNIGIMQGRLSPRVNGKIQAFPFENWMREFQSAKELGFSSIEWIVENPLILNPLFSEDGANLIVELIKSTGVKIEFICADIFMENPIINQEDVLIRSKNLINKLINYGNKIGAKCIEIPFVDNSSLQNKDFNYLTSFFNSFEYELEKYDQRINLETDLNPLNFYKLLNDLNPKIGANYDIGNSASLGYDFQEELNFYGNRILNVHVKDRQLGGSTVDFGTGNADIKGVLNYLATINYKEGIVIQGARGFDDIETAQSQLNYVKSIINELNNV
jgi:hexulose-6-phosphate isomerase